MLAAIATAVADDTVINKMVGFTRSMIAQPLRPGQAHALIDRVVDTLACGIVAAAEPEVERVSRAVLALGGTPRCTLLSGGKTSPEHAAYLNGFAIRYLDWNDTYVGRNGGHPSDLIPAAFAAGEYAGKSGLEVLRALAVGTHLMLDLCDAADAFSRGWDHATYTGIASAVTAGILLDLSPDDLGHAIALTAVSGNMLIARSGRVSAWKGLAAPHAIRNGVYSAVLAHASVTGPSPIFEGDFGFIRHVSGPLELELSLDRDRTADTYLKRFPAVYHAQGPIEIALELRDEIVAVLGLFDVAAHIEDVLVEIYAFGVTWGAESRDKWNPQNRETADHSIPFMVALAFATGQIEHRDLDAAIRDKAVLHLTQKVRVIAEPAFTPKWPKQAPSRVSVRAEGKVFVREITAPYGHVTRPMPSAMVDQKFLGATAKAIGAGKAHRWLGNLRRFDQLESLTEALRPPNTEDQHERL